MHSFIGTLVLTRKRLPLESPDLIIHEVDATGSWDLKKKFQAPQRCIDHTYYDYSRAQVSKALDEPSNQVATYDPLRLENQQVDVYKYCHLLNIIL
jgi:hypothetical protein